MPKGAVGLVAGYWPDGVYRYIATPGLSLDEGLVGRPVKRRGREVAIVSPSGVLTYDELAAEVDKSAGALLHALGDRGTRCAIAIRDPLTALLTFLGALRARSTVCLADPSEAAKVLARQFVAFKPDLVVVDDLDGAASGVAAQQGIRPVASADLSAPVGRAKPTVRIVLKAPAVAIPGAGGSLAYHSHSSMLSGALSWSTFLALADDERLLCTRPLHTWEGLYSVLPALFRGASTALVCSGSTELVAQLERHRPTYALLPLEEAIALGADRVAVGELRKALRGVFVSVDRPFRVTARQRLERLLGRPVMTVYGRPDIGPALASHPSWYLEEAIGIPVTNVDVWPLNPATGRPLEVPWEAIEYAEIGVKSSMTAVDRQPHDGGEGGVPETWWRTRLVATMDPSGFFHFLSSPSPEGRR